MLRGVILTYEAYYAFLTHADVERPLLPALEAVDLFFMALAFIILAIGLAQLFMGEIDMVKNLSISWLRVESFVELKLLLWDTLVVTILVLFVTRLITTQTFGWDTLVLPSAILMLSIGSFLLKQKH